jgi:hypothetical protein
VINTRSRWTAVLLLLLLPALLPAWDIAPLQFPVFIPTNGYLSETGFPIAIRNLDFNFFPYAGISTTLLLYNIQGLGVTGLPTDKPIIGPTYTLVGNLCLKLMLPIQSFLITAKGGGFAFYNLSPFLMSGNLAEAIAEDKGWDKAVVDDMSFDNVPGYGWVVGGSFTYYVIRGLGGIFLEVLYYDGEAPLNLSGTATGIKGGTVVANEVDVSYSDVKIDFSGIEIILGITLSL